MVDDRKFGEGLKLLLRMRTVMVDGVIREVIQKGVSFAGELPESLRRLLVQILGDDGKGHPEPVFFKQFAEGLPVLQRLVVVEAEADPRVPPDRGRRFNGVCRDQENAQKGREKQGMDSSHRRYLLSLRASVSAPSTMQPAGTVMEMPDSRSH